MTIKKRKGSLTTQEWSDVVAKGYRELLGDSKVSCGRDYVKSMTRELNHFYAYAWADGYKACLLEEGKII